MRLDQLAKKRYRIEGDKITIEPNLKRWVEWYQSSAKERVVGQTERGKYVIITFFTGVDARFDQVRVYGRFKSPVLWVSQVFVDSSMKDAIHFSGSREVAEAFHKEYVNTFE